MARRMSWSRRILAGVLIGFCMLIFVQGRYGMPVSFERTFSKLLYPVLAVQRSIASAWQSWREGRHNQAELIRLVHALSDERDALQGRIIELLARLEYGEETKELREFAYRYTALSTYGILVHVLVRNLSEQEQFFLVDAGENRGICKDMIAVYHNGLVGRVVDVFPAYSKVLLMTDKLCKVACYGAHSHAQGIHEGTNQVGVSRVAQVSHLEHMHVGDLILSSGEGLIFPAGFGLGLVSSCTTQGLFYEVDVEPLFDMSEISYCYLFARGDEVVPRAAIQEDEHAEHA